ncbi:MAG: PD-(D/E)XK nuclease family protein [Acidobacteria bacterium]|nr:PD-(D/E)XK nuclease family protein [Acidobacteriota bacterium]
MARASIVVSCSAFRRLAAAGDWLRDRGRGDEETLLLAASRGAADDLVRDLSVNGHGILGVHRASLDQWALQTAALELAARDLNPVTTLGTEAMAARVARMTQTAGELERLSPVAGMPGFARSLAATIGELRAAGVPPAELRLDDRTRDLDRLLRRFEEEMDRFGLADMTAVLRLAGMAIAKADIGVPPASLWLDLPLRSASEAEVLRTLAGRSREVLATVAAGDDEAFAWLDSVLEERTVIDLDREELAGGGASAGRRLDRVQRRVFETAADTAPATDADVPANESVELFSAAGEGQECVEIARRIHRAAAAGLAFDRMAILVRQPAGYLPLVEDALGRAGIPAYITRGTLRPNPAGRAFLALLACAGERLSATRFAEYLSLGQTPEPAAGGAPPRREVPWVEPAGEQLVLKSPGEDSGSEDGADSGDGDAPLAEDGVGAGEDAAPAGALRVPAHWERLLVDAAVVGGAERWRERLAGRRAEFRLQLRDVGDEDDGRRSYLERQIDRLETLQAFALPLIQFLDDLPARADWALWLERLGELATMALRRPESVLEVLAELRPLTQVDEVGLAEVERILGERLRFRRSRPPKRRFGRVFVGGVEETAGRSFDLVFVPGLAEGVFPRRTGEDPLLLDERREALRQAGYRLAGNERRTWREQLLLRLAIGAANRRLVVSYPRVDLVQGRARVPSLYALDVLRGAEGRLPDLEELGRRAEAGGAAVVGWPAPKKPEDAVDESEFDLALLRPYLGAGAPVAQRRGRARFLLESNEHLKRALEARGRRWRRPWFPVDGLVNASPEALEALAAQRTGARSYSPTALQHYAACPYRFFLQAVLRLYPRDEFVQLERLDPMTRGSIFHEIQFRLFGVLKEADLLPVTADNLRAVFARLDDVLYRSERDFHDELAPPIERVWKAEFESLRADLRGWLRQVADEGGRWKAIHAELSFGLRRSGDRDPHSSPEPAEVLDIARLRGSIDLVEEDAAGRLRVTDHKTGRPVHAREDLVIGGGKVLQPVLYSLAAERVLEREVVSGRLSYCTQRGDYSNVSVPLDERSRGAARRLLKRVDEALETGFLPAAPGKDECRYCDYRRVCGPYEELRVKRKDQTRLEELNALRSER